MTKVKLKDATRELLADATKVKEEASRARKGAENLLQSLRALENGFVKANEEKDAEMKRAEAEKQLMRFGYPRFDVETSGKGSKLFYNSLVTGLERALRREDCVLYKLFDAQALRSLKILKCEKNIPARIRLAGMLYQTAKWFENENIYF